MYSQKFRIYNLIKITFYGLLIFFFVYNLDFGATLNGNVKIDFSEQNETISKIPNYGIFVLAEETGNYDITDSNGNFKIKNLEINKEYTFLFQKGGLKDYRQKIKIKNEENFEQIIISFKKSEVKVVSGSIITVAEKPKLYPVKGLVKSKFSRDIFIDIKNKGYGIITKSNEPFEFNLESGKYSLEFRQEGSHSKIIDFEVSKKGVNDLGIIELLEKDIADLNLEFNGEIDGEINIYKDDRLRYSQKIINKKNIKFLNLKQDKYKLVVKTNLNDEYTQSILLDSDKTLKINFENFQKIAKKNLIVNIYPENIIAKIKLFKYDETLKLVSEGEYKGYAHFENIDPDAIYKIYADSKNYKNVELDKIHAGDKLDIFFNELKNEITISGTVFPFEEGINVFFLGDSTSIKTITDKNGYYELKVSTNETGIKKLRFSKEGYLDKYLDIEISEKDIKNINVMMRPSFTKLYGKVILENAKKHDNIMVILNELNLWYLTDESGDYAFTEIPEGEYNVTFQKTGYRIRKEKIRVTKDSVEQKKVTLVPYGKIIFKSSLKDYDLYINGIKENVKEKIFEKDTGIGIFNIRAYKEGFEEVKGKLELSIPGEETEFKIDFLDIKGQISNIALQLNEVDKMIDDLKISLAEMKLAEISRLKYVENHIVKYREVEAKLAKAKKRVEADDLKIREELRKLKEIIAEVEQRKIGFHEKAKIKEQKIKEIIEYTEKLIEKYNYTTLKEEIYTFQAELYNQIGMPNSASRSLENAKKYR